MLITILKKSKKVEKKLVWWNFRYRRVVFCVSAGQGMKKLRNG